MVHIMLSPQETWRESFPLEGTIGMKDFVLKRSELRQRADLIYPTFWLSSETVSLFLFSLGFSVDHYHCCLVYGNRFLMYVSTFCVMNLLSTQLLSILYLSFHDL